MDNTEIRMDLRLVKQELLQGIYECSERGLKHTVKWLSELNHSLVHVKLEPDERPRLTDDSEGELDVFLRAKSYFEMKEYDRCAFFLKDCKKPKPRFLFFYSRYLSSEKKKLDNMTDSNCPPDPTENKDLRTLCTELKCDYSEDRLDGFCMYLYGVILKKLDLLPLCTEVFIKAVKLQPTLWCAWYELAKLIPDKIEICTADLPDHWIKQFYLAHAYLEQLNNDESLHLYNQLCSQGFESNTYLMAQMAIAYHNKRELEKAINTFNKVLSIDPYRLDNLDTYSNLLYVEEMKTQLADLAQKAVTIDKYRVETCCVIGNYYSLRSDHAKAVWYFRRALKLNPMFLSAWTLMGHEFMEMKNTNAAIQSYRHAIEINNRDYRAWYGLGQTYEILKMPYYCLYYYKQAQQLKPNDSRMIIAIGDTYEKLEKTENALKCYLKACTIGDVEGLALVKLAKLYDKVNDADNAASVFSEYCLREDDAKDKVYEDQTEYYNALQYLANYHMDRGNLDDAYTFAYKCVECEETKEQGKALMKAIARRRLGMTPEKPEPINETVEMSETENDSIDMVTST